ncbi:DEAD/DEAH box helicase [Acetatifactor muris]|uniref:DEAD/DEAH box helicase n=1 Tax=Acetatifactor muris TaxID=879566 RepID=UPI0023F0C3A7|nr:AAA domain-containing protein [Acetatifactor muris]
MRIVDLKTDHKYVCDNVQCRMLIRQSLISRDGRVEMAGENKFRFITRDTVTPFTVSDKSDAGLMEDYFSRHYVCLAQATALQKNVQDGESAVFFLHMTFFYHVRVMGKVPIVLSDRAVESIEKNYMRRGGSLEGVLRENFEMTDGSETCFVFAAGKNTPEADLDEEGRALGIFGKDFSIYATVQGKDLDLKLYADQIRRTPRNLPPLELGRGGLEFSDRNTILSRKVKEILEETRGYLDLWNQYADQEGQILLNNARKVGLIQLNREAISYDAKGIHVQVKGLTEEADRLISAEDRLFFSEEVPVYLADANMTWEDYRQYKEEADENKMPVHRGRTVRILEKKNSGFVLEAEDGFLPEERYVSLSIYGDEMQIDRRGEARRLIAEGRAANPGLGLILEGRLPESVLGGSGGRKRIEPLSDFVLSKIFAYPPTETQKMAIDIALNTPDIAIIQGPPGTGKTTVITAIIERLNEICSKKETISGQVLITSFQHDAVRNVIERLRINDLPTIKFGRQERTGEEDLTRERVIEEWCEEYARKLRDKNPAVRESYMQQELIRLHNFYIAFPGSESALAFLECAKKLNMDMEVNRQIEKLTEEYKVQTQPGESELLPLIRRIRTKKESFTDDGAENADLLLWQLEEAGINKRVEENERVYQVLDRAAEYLDREPPEELLRELAEVKKYLLKKCSPRPLYKREYPRDEILEIFTSVNRQMQKKGDKEAEILAELLHELETDRTEVERSLEHYLFVYSATTQQSEGEDIRKAKGIRKYSREHPEYETVVVDEAARVSPVDLMIPLSQARRRIILVGDHRQLPHIYDEEVFENMEADGDSGLDMDNIKKSMFEYLLEKARMLEKQDKIRRTIVLDAQYRMHPLLGEFVDEVFYRPHGEHFASPSPAERYAQKLYDKPLRWYDFPDRCGREERVSTSRQRECEADFIVSLVEKQMRSEEGKELTYGIISFYSAQVKLIKAKLRSRLGKDAEKIRVGSVDAFQGMEFDVIYLSVVRSAKTPVLRIDGRNRPIDFDLLEKKPKQEEPEQDDGQYREWNAYKEKVGMQNYGFLTSENRLCVSLSRQKRMLIIVGNSELFHKGDWGRIAEVCVPGMKRLYELCKREDVIENGSAESFQPV